MMDMELNADLDRDGGSDAGEASLAGSSAGSVYCALEMDFARITEEMRTNEVLANFEGEYTRLFESLYKAHKVEEQLTEKCNSLKEEVTLAESQIAALTKQARKDMATIEKLNLDVIEEKKVTDATHTREQMGQEMIENLRISIAKLAEEIEHKNKQLAMGDSAPVAKPAEGLSKERERMLDEIEALKQRLKTITNYNRELENNMSQAEKTASEMQDRIDRQAGDISKERRECEKLENELQETTVELNARLADLETVEETLRTTTANAAKQEVMLREQIRENDRNKIEISKLMSKLMSTKMESERLVARNLEARKEVTEQSKYIKELNLEIQRMKDEAKQLRTDRENSMKKLAKEAAKCTKAEDNLGRATANLRNADVEIVSFKKLLETEHKDKVKLNREKEVAVKNVSLLEAANDKLAADYEMLDQTNRKLATSLEEMEAGAKEAARQISGLEKDKDRCRQESQDLLHKVEDCMDDLKLKQMDIADFQKRLVEADVKYRQLQTLFEEIRAERNTYKKNLSSAQEEINDLKERLRNMNMQLDQQKDELLAKEASLMKQEFMLTRLEKEKDGLQSDLQASRKTNSELRKEMGDMKEEEKRLRGLLTEAETRIKRQGKDLETVMNERDVIGTQMVRRNDELSLLYNKNQIFIETIKRGEVQYAQRLDDIKMLKLEVKKLRMRSAALEKNTANLCDLRGELCHMERDLTKERIKVMALEEEVQNPLNVHRWRNLEGSDPDTFELINKIQILQRRLFKMTSIMISKDKKMKDMERVYQQMCDVISKQPGPEILFCLSKTRRALRERSKKMKCLVAELNMSLSNESKFELDKMKKDLEALKAKCLAERKKDPRPITVPAEKKSSRAAPKQILGGGFRLSASTIEASSESLNK